MAKAKQLLMLTALTLGMFGFGFALVPLYEVFCDLTGLNGKTKGQVLYSEKTEVNKERLIRVRFLAEVGRGMPWDFKPEVKEIKVHPGQLVDTHFLVNNRSKETIIAQAVPSVSPGLMINYFHKTECFCFNQQELVGEKSMAMPLRFFIDTDIPAEVNTLTLSYTLYNVTPKELQASTL